MFSACLSNHYPACEINIYLYEKLSRRMKYSHIVNSVAALALLSLSLNASNVPGESARKCGNNAPEDVSGIKIGGYIGSRIDLCNSGMIMQENVDELVEPFRHKNDTWSWSTEFIGK